MAPINCRRVSGCRRWVSRGRSAVAGGGWEGVHPTSLTYWRRRLARSDRPNRIFDAVRQVVAETGALAGKTRRALDSTVLDDAVATQDTVTQLIAAIRRAAREVPDAVRTPTGHRFEPCRAAASSREPPTSVHRLPPPSRSAAQTRAQRRAKRPTAADRADHDRVQHGRMPGAVERSPKPGTPAHVLNIAARQAGRSIAGQHRRPTL
jgi:hypothetical protein